MTDSPRFGMRVRAKLPSIGRCVYCWNDGVDLTTEHIVPRSLGGKIEFLKASCECCRKITQKFEEDCSRKTFFRYRVRSGYPASARHEWPKSFSILKDGPNGQKIETHVPAKEIPRLLVMMTFPVAGILRDRDPTVHVSMQPWYSVHRGDLSKIIGVRHEGEFHTLSFCRMIAKIGHCFATATINQSYFSNLDFLLCDFIRTGSGSPFHLVGCDSLIPPAEAGAPHHTIDLMLTSNKQRQFLAAKVRLFGYRAAPVYHAVVAELINRSLPLTYNDAALEEMQRKADKPPPET